MVQLDQSLDHLVPAFNDIVGPVTDVVCDKSSPQLRWIGAPWFQVIVIEIIPESGTNVPDGGRNLFQHFVEIIS